MIVEIILIILTVFLFIVYLFINYGRARRYVMKLPGPPAYAIIGNLPMLLVSNEKLWDLARQINKDYYPIYRLTTLHLSIVNIRHPDDAEILLSSTTHVDKSLIYKILHPWFGTGLLTSGGSKWRKRRKILTPAFHFNVLKKYTQIITENSSRLIESLKLEGESVQDLVPLISQYTLNVICESAMGVQTQGKEMTQKSYREAIQKLSNILVYRFLRPWLYSNWLFNRLKKGREQKSLLNTLHGFTTQIINERKDYHEKTKGQFLKDFFSNESKSDDEKEVYGIRKRRLAMLDLLIAAQNRGQIDDDGIREEVDTFTFEGHDTTAMALCFILLLLAEHKDVQNKARTEITEVLSESNGRIDFEELQHLHYLEQCIKESLRLYPSVTFISRDINEDLQLKNYLVPKGAIAHLHIYDLHRDPNFWPEPDKFNPDRFLPENTQNRHPFSYIPFSAGPRNCIGQKFAMLELKSVVCHLLHNFYLEPVDLAHEVPILADLVIRPARPIHIKLVPIPHPGRLNM